MSDSKKKIYLGEDLVCQTFTDAEEQAKAFDLFGLEQPVVSSNAPASTRPVQQGQVCEFDGVDDYISAAHLTGSETVTSSVGTSTPSISAGRIDFTAGKCSNLILSDGTQYNLNHASGTTAFDSSGNGNDGTLQNGAAFVVDNTLPPEADRLNLDGYTDDSGVLIPRDESDPTKDTDGNPLQYSGSVYPRRPEYRNSYAASFDGIDDYIELPAQVLSHNQAWSIEVDFKFLATPTYRTLYGEGNSATGTPQINLGILGTHTQLDLFWRSDNNTTILNEALFPVVSGNQYIVKVTFDGVDEVTVWKDGVVTHTFTITPLVTTVDRATFGALGRSGVGSFSNAEFFHIKTTQGGSTVGEYTLTEGAGATAHDVSGNGNHGTINNASTGTEGAGFWAGRIDGEANALNNKNGFSRKMLFDGVDDYVSLGAYNLSYNTDFKVAGSFISTSTARGDFLTFYGGYGAFQATLATESGQFGVFLGENGVAGRVSITSSIVEGLNTYVVSYVGGVASVTLNGSSAGSGSWGSTQPGASSIGARFGMSGNGYRAWSGILGKTSIDIGATGDYDNEYSGCGNTDADWTDQIGSNNGTVNGSPALLRIPADTSDPTKDVFGDTLTNPAITDGYNDSETELDAYNIADGDNPSPATNDNPGFDAIEFGTDFASNDAAYMRLKSSTENDRLITFENDLTGGDETLAQKYTQ